MVFDLLTEKCITRILYTVVFNAKPTGSRITAANAVCTESLIFTYHSNSLKNAMKSNIFVSNSLYTCHLSHDSYYESLPISHVSSSFCCVNG